MGKKSDKKDDKKRKKKKGRLPCCEKEGVRRGAWTPEEDKILVDFITENGHGTWRNLPKLAGLLRCGKSCRLRWTNYLRPDIKRGPFSPQEENTIIHLHETLGNKWAAIACHLPGRTDNDVKNFWNSHLMKRIARHGLDSSSPTSNSVDVKPNSSFPGHTAEWETVDPLPPSVKPFGDYFIRLWNSEVGDSFRNINESMLESDGGVCHSPGSQTSSLTKVESWYKPERHGRNCLDTNLPEIDDEKIWSFCKKEPEDLATYSDTSKSCEMDDSSDAMLKLLLEFPAGENDMGFLQGTFDGVYT